MITRDLFELANLDVLGLLDEDERREFEQAFREAPPALQAQIRREQLRVTDIDEWLPKVDAPASLKPRVLGAVREAVEAVRAGQGREHVARKIGPFALSLQRNVSPLWRAAALGFAAATLFVGYQFLNSVGRFNQVTELATSEDALSAFNTPGGASFARALRDSTMRSVAFNAGPGAVSGKEPSASVFGADGKGAFLYCSLPKAEGGYRLVVVADDGSIAKEIARFNPAAGQQVVALPAMIAAGTKLAILPLSAGDNLGAALLVSKA